MAPSYVGEIYSGPTTTGYEYEYEYLPSAAYTSSYGLSTSAASYTLPADFDLMKAMREQHPHLFNEDGSLKEGLAFSNAMKEAGQPVPVATGTTESHGESQPASQVDYSGQAATVAQQEFDLEASRRLAE